VAASGFTRSVLLGFGWQHATKGWGTEEEGDIRLLFACDRFQLSREAVRPFRIQGMSADPGGDEQVSLTRHGILDADYERAAKKDSQLEVLLLPDRTPILLAALRVVDSAEAPTASLSSPDDAFDAANAAANSSR